MLLYSGKRVLKTLKVLSFLSCVDIIPIETGRKCWSYQRVSPIFLDN